MTRRLLIALLLLCLSAFAIPALADGQLHFCVQGEPKTLNPMLAGDDPSETIRYLTAGVLLRINRSTQELQPELATSWKLMNGGREIEFNLRKGVRFSDGTPFDSSDVVYTFGLVADPKIQSSTADSFKTEKGAPKAVAEGANRVRVVFPQAITAVERLFDQLPLMSSRSPQKEGAVLGPFMIAEHKPGAHVLLKRNPNYWKRDSQGRQLPYLDSVLIEVQQNRDVELLRFKRGELHIVNNLMPDLFESLVQDNPKATMDLGPSLEGEQMWFNQVEASPIPAYKKTWFRSATFRRAVSESINRSDIARIVYFRHATPGVGPVSPSNKLWFNRALKPHPFDPPAALKKLEAEGFQRKGDVLYDGAGHAVEFSIITNAGNKAREKMAALIQQDLRQIGIKLNVVTLDFPSLIERITHSFDYEACVLGLTNVDPDPNWWMPVWLSSGENHQWNPNQKTPQTDWEAELDRLMQKQAISTDAAERKKAFDRVQQIVWEQAPFIYLINKNALVAVSENVRGTQLGVIRPQVYWNVEYLSLAQK